MFSCSKEDFTINNLNNKIVILGHGGMGISQPYHINTYESILECINAGADGTEIDIQMTKDSVLIAYHSKDLSEETNLNGIVNDLEWGDIKNGYYYSTPYIKYSIISLEQLFSNIDNLHNYKFTFDCKLYTNSNNVFDFQKSFINAIAKLIDKYSLQKSLYIESQNSDFLMRLQEKDENYKLFIYPNSFENGLNIALSLDLYGITISSDDISLEQIETAHNNNLYIAIWNTHSKNKNIDAVNKNPDFIQTDRVKHLVYLLQ